jgi:hypothetical protein
MPFDPITYGATQAIRIAAELAETNAAASAVTAAAEADAAAASAAQLAAGVASPAGTFANLEALNAGTHDHGKIYITLDDGKWCYYNGSAWVAGGVYQAASVAAELAEVTSQLADNTTLLSAITTEIDAEWEEN